MIIGVKIFQQNDDETIGTFHFYLYLVKMTTNVIIILHAGEGEKNSRGIITFAVAVKYGKHNFLTYALALS